MDDKTKFHLDLIVNRVLSSAYFLELCLRTNGIKDSNLSMLQLRMLIAYRYWKFIFCRLIVRFILTNTNSVNKNPTGAAHVVV